MKVKWAQLVEKYIGKPYELCGWGNPGYDCFSILITIMRDSGVNISAKSKFDGFGLTDYNTLWDQDKSKAREVVLAALKPYLIEHEGPVIQGDVVMLSCGNKETFLGLYVSNRIISVVKNKGVKAYPTKCFTIHNKYKVNYEPA